MTALPINTFIENWRVFYSNLEPTLSPALNTQISFNSQGFNHLLFKKKVKRTDKVIFNRLPLLPLIVPVIKNCSEIKEVRTRKENIKGKEKEVSFFSLEANVGRGSPRVRVA